MFDKFTDDARKVMGYARRKAIDRGEEYIRSEHLLWGVAQQERSLATLILLDYNIHRDALIVAIEAKMGGKAFQQTMSKLPFSDDTKRVLERTLKESIDTSKTYINTDHLLVGLYDIQGKAQDTLKTLGIPDTAHLQRTTIACLKKYGFE